MRLALQNLRVEKNLLAWSIRIRNYLSGSYSESNAKQTFLTEKSVYYKEVLELKIVKLISH